MENKEIRNCHYCTYAVCNNDTDENCMCYVEDGAYFSHYVKNSNKEAKECDFFEYDSCFPKH